MNNGQPFDDPKPPERQKARQDFQLCLSDANDCAEKPLRQSADKAHDRTPIHPSNTLLASPFAH